MKSPSVKNSLLILVAALLVGGAFLIAEYRNKNAEAIYKDSISVSGTSDTTAQNKDSDEDGLKDWEEVLLGTDIDDADTDRDGTSDGKEVTDKRNPTIPGPKDKLSVTATTDLTKEAEVLDPLDTLSRQFFAKYMEFSKLGISQDPLNRQELIDTAVGSIPFESPTTYTTATILVKADSSTLAIKNYGNEVAGAIQKNLIVSRNERIIAKEALEKEDPSVLKEIDPIIVSYTKLLTALRQIQAPQAVATLHVSVVNGMSAGLFAAQSFRNSGDDPVKALQGAKAYQEGQIELRNALIDIRAYMTFLGITYTEDESGYLPFTQNEE